MVMDYADIYRSVAELIPDQDWYDPAWRVRQSGDAIEVFREGWVSSKGDSRLLFRSFGQGEDPEQKPVVMEIRFGPEIEEPDRHRGDLLEALEELIRPLIGWHEGEDPRLLLRKELPSDPLTLQPRLLQEFKMLEPLARAIDEYLAGVSGNAGASAPD